MCVRQNGRMITWHRGIPPARFKRSTKGLRVTQVALDATWMTTSLWKYENLLYDQHTTFGQTETNRLPNFSLVPWWQPKPCQLLSKEALKSIMTRHKSTNLSIHKWYTKQFLSVIWFLLLKVYSLIQQGNHSMSEPPKHTSLTWFSLEITQSILSL